MGMMRAAIDRVLGHDGFEIERARIDRRAPNASAGRAAGEDDAIHTHADQVTYNGSAIKRACMNFWDQNIPVHWFDGFVKCISFLGDRH